MSKRKYDEDEDENENENDLSSGITLYQQIFSSERRNQMKNKYAKYTKYINSIEIGIKDTKTKTEPEPKFLECCICFEMKKAFTNDLGEVLSLSEIENVSIENESETFLGPCSKHPFCKDCLKRIVTDYTNHPINSSNSMVKCMYPFDECMNDLGIYYIFQHANIKKVLTPDEFKIYMEHANRYRFPGYEIVKCPVTLRIRVPGSPITRNLQQIEVNRIEFTEKVCCSENLVKTDLIEMSKRGKLIVVCTQNPECLNKFCFSCKRKVFFYDTECSYCLKTQESFDPYADNMYFYKLNRIKGDKLDPFYKNGELTEEIVTIRLKEIISMDKVYLKCPECLVVIDKTSHCNGMSHCNIEICRSCGRFSYPGRTLVEHWSDDGMRGCPRWDFSNYWNYVAQCDFKCSDSFCYGDLRDDCKYIDHQKGIIKMQTENKRCMVYHTLKSLLPELREKVYWDLYRTEDPLIRFYLPDSRVLEILKTEYTPDEYTMYNDQLLINSRREEEPKERV